MRLAYLAATLLVFIAPGTDKLLAISRGPLACPSWPWGDSRGHEADIRFPGLRG